MTLSAELTQHVELICLKGCETVREIITALENGEPVDDIATLPDAAQQAILVELKSIMAIYDQQQD